MHKFAFIIAVSTLVGCASNPNRAEKINTVIVHEEKISGDTKLGLRDGLMIVQHKVLMSEELRDLQISVYSLEDGVYGNDVTGNRGTYGVLRDCKRDLALKENGGSGKLSWAEPLDRVVPENEDMKIGLDEKDALVGVTEEFLKTRINRFRSYKSILRKRGDDLQLKLDVCESDLRSHRYDMQAQHRTVSAD